MAWYDGLFNSDSGLSDQDKGKLANQGLLQAGLGILAANGQRGTTPFQAIAGGLLGGLGGVQQGTADIQNQRYKSAIEQSTLANMQRQQQAAQQADQRQKDLAQAFQDNTDASGNVNYDSALRQYGKSHPEDFANAKQQIYGGAPKIQDTPQGAVAIYPNGNYEFLHPSDVPAVQNAAQSASAMPQSIPAPQGAPGGGSAYTPPPPLLAAVEGVESGGNPNAVSPKGAKGLLQVTDATASNPGYGIAPSNGTMADRYRVGQQYLGYMLNKYGTIGGLAAYNAGPGSWEQHLHAANGDQNAALAAMPAETQAYVPKVLNAAGQTTPNGLPQGANPSQLPAGRISLQMPSKTTNADDEKYAKLIALGVPQAAALEASYGVKPQTVQANAAPSPDGNLPSGQDYLNTLPQARRDLAQAVIDGRYQIPKGFSLKNPQSWQLIQDVVQADPSFDATNYDARSNAAKQFTSATSPNAPANQIRSIQTIAGHLSTIYGILPKLDLSSVGTVNDVKNWWAGKQGVTDPNYTKSLGAYQQAAKSIGDETAKLFAGTGSALADRQEVAHMLDPSQPKEKLEGSLGTLADLIQSRLDALNGQAQTALGPMAASRLKIVSPEQQMVLDNIKALAGGALYGTTAKQAPSKPLMSSPRPNAGWSIQQVSN